MGFTATAGPDSWGASGWGARDSHCHTCLGLSGASVATTLATHGPLLVGVDAGSVTEPALLLRLEEDHSIGTLGNELMDGNFEELAGPAWLASIPDAGHSGHGRPAVCGVLRSGAAR